MGPAGGGWSRRAMSGTLRPSQQIPERNEDDLLGVELLANRDHLDDRAVGKVEKDGGSVMGLDLRDLWRLQPSPRRSCGRRRSADATVRPPGAIVDTEKCV